MRLVRRRGAARCACPNGCCDEVARLREENAALRRSAQTFGELAERLNMQLQRERARAAAVKASAHRRALSKLRWFSLDWLRRRRDQPSAARNKNH